MYLAAKIWSYAVTISYKLLQLVQATPYRRIQRCRCGCCVMFNVGSKWIWIVSFTFRPVYPTLEKSLAVNHRIGGWVGSADILPTAEKWKVSYPCRASSQESSHYTDWATPASLTGSNLAHVTGPQYRLTDWRSWNEFFWATAKGGRAQVGFRASGSSVAVESTYWASARAQKIASEC